MTSYLTITIKNNQNVSRMSLKLIEKDNQNALHTHQRLNARSCSMQKIQSNCQIINQLIQEFKPVGWTTPRAGKQVNEESAVEKSVAASVEWNMVPMDLLANYK
jgi:hypothetical protein